MNLRNPHFDQIKGILILLVIIGHVLLGSLEQNSIRAFIYFFHMPVFLAISGYFISQKTLSLSIKQLLKKYWSRMLLPFLLAVITYTLVVSEPITFLYPYYHLWYIPAVLLFIFYLKFMNEIKLKSYLFLTLMAIFITLTAFFESYSQWTLSNSPLYKLLGDKRFYYFFSYFALGYYLGNNQNRPISKQLAIVALLPLIAINQTDNILLQGISKTIINFILIYLTIRFCETAPHHFSIKLLERIGQISLPIYLWHIMPLLWLKSLKLSPSNYYLSSIGLFTFFIFILLKLEDRSSIINQLIYGKA